MRELTIDVAEGPSPPYLRLARAIRDRILQGQAVPGELLPSTRKLSQMAGLHRHTVMSALDELVAEGWIESERGRGYRVTALLARDLKVSSVERTAERVYTLARRAEAYDAPAALPFSFPSGQPDLRLFPSDEVFGCMRDVLRRADAKRLLGYSAAGGTASLLEQLRVYLRRMRGLTGGEIVVTHGSQEAIFLLGQLLISPDDVVAVEALGYAPAWEALRVAGANLMPLPLDAHGVVPDALEELASRQRVKMVYLTPLHQYPTTVTLPAARRLALYDVCMRHDILILEDDYDHEFHFRSQPVAPMAAHDPAGLVMYVSTFSKVLFPSARLGFAVVAPALAAPMRNLKQVSSRQNDTLMQEAVARWMASGGFERHLRRMRRVYDQRMHCMADTLDREAREREIPLTTRRPDGGMSLWVSLGISSERLAREAAHRGVAVRPGSVYRLDGQDTPWLRLGYAAASEDEISQGIPLLLDAARSIGQGRR